MENSKANPVEVQKELKGVDYPASKQDLLEHVKKNGNKKEVLDLLEEIPEKKYDSPVEVTKAVGKLK